jgi:hypothetical protein
METEFINLARRINNCMAIVTKHKPYFGINLDWAREIMRIPIIVDGRNVIDAIAARKAGFLYKGIGKGKN